MSFQTFEWPNNSLKVQMNKRLSFFKSTICFLKSKYFYFFRITKQKYPILGLFWIFRIFTPRVTIKICVIWEKNWKTYPRMKLSSLVVLLAASGDAKPSPEARAALKAKKNTQDLAWELLFKSGKPWVNQIRLHTLVSGWSTLKFDSLIGPSECKASYKNLLNSMDT